MTSIVSQTPLNVASGWEQQQYGSYGGGNYGGGGGGNYGQSNYASYGPQSSYGGGGGGYGGPPSYGAPPTGGSYGHPGPAGNKQQASGSALELEDGANVDDEIAKQIKKGLIDAADVAPPNADELEQAPRQVFRRKVKKMVEVPITRKVKVPTTTQKLVEGHELHKVKTKKQVQEPSSKWVEEAYTEIEEIPATRMKEVWVKKLVPETYMKKVEVRKTRKIKVAVMELKEIEVEEEVKVPTTKMVEIPSYRIDEIKDTKLVEVEGYQEVELVPRIRDTNIKIERSRDVNKHHRKIERRVGVEEYGDDDSRLQDVDTDSDPDDEYTQENILRSHGDVRLEGTEKRTKPKGSARRAHRFLAAAQATDLTDILDRHNNNGGKTPTTTQAQALPTNFVPLPPSKTKPGYSAATPQKYNRVPTPPSAGNVFMMFGFRLVEQDRGLQITQVTKGGYAEKGGLNVGDVIRSVDGRNLNTIREWRSLLSCKSNNAELLIMMERASGEMDAIQLPLTNFNPKQYMDDPVVHV